MKLAFDKLNQHQIIIQRQETKPVMLILCQSHRLNVFISPLFVSFAHYRKIEWKMNYGLN